MRGFNKRYAFAGLLALLCAWLVSHGDRHVFGQPVPLGVPKAKDDDKEKEDEKELRPPDDDELVIRLPYDRDARRQLTVAADYLKFKTIPWPTVCELLQRILDSKSDSFYTVAYEINGNKKWTRVSVKTEANRILSTFPKDGLEVYQQLFGQDATKELEAAKKDDYDLAGLSDVSQRYFHTKAGAQATILLGTIYLERGNYLEAAYSFERLLVRPDADDVLSGRTLYKAALAMKHSEDPRHAESLKQVMSRLSRIIAKDGDVVIGRRSLSIEQIQAELEQPFVTIRPSAYLTEWAMRYGNISRNATVDGGAPFLEPLYTPTRMIDKSRYAEREQPSDAEDWIKAELEAVYDKRAKFPLPAFFPVATPNTIMFRAYDGVYCYATHDHIRRGTPKKAGQLLWYSGATYGMQQLADTNHYQDGGEARRNAITWWETYKLMAASSILFENPVIGSLVHDGTNVYFLDDIALPPPPAFQNPNNGFQPVPPPNHGPVADGVRASQLVAVNMQSGSVSWALGRPTRTSESSSLNVEPKLPPPEPLNEEEADKSTDAYRLCIDAVFLGPPLPLNGRLYIMMEPGNGGQIRLVCLDPQVMVHPKDYPHLSVPTLVWSQKLGKPNSEISKDPFRRFQGTFLAAGEGILICPTNSGAVIAVDVMSRSLLWAHAYRKMEAPPANPNTARGVTNQQLPDTRWRSAAPIVSGGRVVLAAYDSTKLECLDIRTGQLLWELPRDPLDLYVGGVVNDKVIIVGRSKIRAYHLNELDPKSPDSPMPLLAWQGSEAIPAPTGHGVAGRGLFFVPVRKDNAGEGTVPAAEIWGINVENGQVVSKTVARPKAGDDRERSEALARYGIGNLIYQDGTVFSQSPWEVAAYPQLDVMRAAMDKRLKEDPNDPIGLTERGVLLLDEGRLKDAISDFKSAETNGANADTKKKIRENLYIAYTELLKADFASAEQYLPEYELLCEAPAEIGDPARRAEESLVRRRLYLDLLAKGREKQGRLAEAFDHYLALATLGGDKLRPDPEDPSVKVRSDVWARGRIDGMIRRTNDPAARQVLESRVTKQWEAVKDGNDLNGLRDFVTVFGPYFPVGSEAELKLAEMLLATNNEADAREAQTLLAHLRVTAEAPAIRGKATETLARLMIRSGLMEDAVALYLQLGKDYADVPIRDGKTGADFLTELLTDKRLLPYLEPGRYPLPTRVKAEQMGADQRGQTGAIFEIEPTGELLPSYRRLRFVMDLTGQNGGSGWSVRAIDRITGQERARFNNLAAVPISTPGNIPFSNFFLGSGHLVTYQLGTMVYCMDLSERKERWKINLMTDPPPGANQNPQIMVQNNEVVVRYPNNTYISLANRVVLQPGYCCLLTQDGLEVFDPINKDRKLWTRRGIPEGTQVFGDARHLLLVEFGEGRKPVSTRLLRAVDGMAVENTRDVSKMLTSATSYQIFGRTILLQEGTGDRPRVVRLYDVAAGKDLWRKEYDSKAVFLSSQDPEWTGAVKSDGTVEVLNLQTGATVANLQIDPDQLNDHLAEAVSAQLFTDRERFFVTLERELNAANKNLMQIYSFSLRNQMVNGPMYCFDRNTGKRLWFTEDASILESQRLILDQFADLPIVVFASPLIEQNNPNVRRVTYKVVIIEKERGKVIFNRGVQHNGNVFQSMSVDPRTGTIDFHRFDLRVSIKPEE